MAPPPAGRRPPASEEAGLFAVFAACRARPSPADRSRAPPNAAEPSRTPRSSRCCRRPSAAERASKRPRPRRRCRPRGRRCPLAADRPRQRPPGSRRGGSGRRRLRGRGGGPGEWTSPLPASRRPLSAGSRASVGAEHPAAPLLPRARTGLNSGSGLQVDISTAWESLSLQKGQLPWKVGHTGVPPRHGPCH
nr:adropin isoform X1 [Microcebus murinus]